MNRKPFPLVAAALVAALVAPVAAGKVRGQDLSRRYAAAHDAGRYREAESVARRALERATASRDEVAIADWSIRLGSALESQGRYPEAETLLKRALALHEKALGAGHEVVAGSLESLAILYYRQSRYGEAEPLYKRALAIVEREKGPDHPFVTEILNNLAGVYVAQGRFAEAEPLSSRVIAIDERTLGPDHPEVGAGLHNLALLYVAQGRYAEGEPRYKRALAIKEKALGRDHPDVASTLQGLANLYQSEDRYGEAEPLYQRTLAIYERALGPDHPELARTLNNLGGLYSRQGRFAEAEPLLKRGLAIKEKKLGPDHPEVAHSVNNLAVLFRNQERYGEAEPLFRRALAVREKALGPDHPDVAYCASGLAELETARGRPAEAERWIDRAIAIADRAATAPGFRAHLYNVRAELAWQAGRRGEALADLREALRFADDQRGQTSGGEVERSATFASYASVYERMVQWQAELGDVGEALAAIERSRGRSLLDELRQAGADLGAGRTAAERDSLRAQEAALKEAVARLEKRANQAGGDPAQAERLRADLSDARRRLYEHQRDARASSPVYQRLLSKGGPPRLSQFQRRLVDHGGLLLVYLFGREQGYVVAIGPDRARLTRLELGGAEANALGVEPGPLTADRLQAVLLDGKTPGVASRLADPKGEGLPPRLAALWHALVPEAERQALTSGEAKRLFVVPDGPLALLPFEALVVDGGEEGSPQCLLDAGPPVSYGPSATVLLDLSERPQAARGEGREPVLALGDPAYPQDGAPAPAEGLLTPRSRFSLAGGKLPRLPYSGWEAQWVAKAFNDQGIKAGVLTGANATEAGVRHWAPGREVLHLACHGLADQEYGNRYGALALAPGPKGDADPDNDGILTLAEIYELDLKGCELAILSACQTNFGPRQQGEGTFALSRGFLVAGCRRVVASNWLVDDKAAAGLMRLYGTSLARSERAREAVDHALALREAKRWVRKQKEWRAPYYWASLVLIGPP